ncbi:MAG: flagellar brake protein [Pseudobdellovibrionaceae bacterium]
MTIDPQGQTIFKKVAFSEKKKLLREVALDKLQISVKGAVDDEMFHLIAVQNEKDELLLCNHTTDSETIHLAQKAVVNFFFKNENYFFQTELNFQSGWVILKIDTDLFQLQRRANARIDLPETYNAVFILNQHAGKAYFLDCKILDISAGGLKIEIPKAQPELKIGEHVKGSLRLGNRRPMDFSVEVRFVQKNEQDGSVTQIAGVQFLKVGLTTEGRLLTLMMDLQRELFLKYTKSK